MFGEISAAFNSIRALTEIAKGLNALQQGVDLNMKSMELTGVIIDIQQRLMATNAEMETLHETIRELKAKLAEKESIKNYLRVKLPTGVVVYQEKEELRLFDDPAYYICPKCLEKDRVAITLQEEHDDPYLRCKVCSSVFQCRPDDHNSRAIVDHDPY